MLGGLRDGVRARSMAGERARLVNDSCSVFSSNCVGAVICHDLGMRFNSPTVNLFMTPRDFVRLAAAPEGHLALDVEDAGSHSGYPVGMLGDVKLHFLHYSSFEEACEYWHRRAARVDLMNSRWILVDRDGLDEETARDFDALDLPGKVILTHRRWDGVGCAFVCPQWEENGSVQTRDLCAYRGGLHARPTRWIDDFDYVAFFDNGSVKAR